MKCREMVELMTDYLEGALSPNDRRRFDDHIAGCDGCRAYLAQMRRTVRVLGRLTEDAIPEHVQRELLATFRDWKSTARP
jgi:anti-sigma factor RsiW